MLEGQYEFLAGGDALRAGAGSLLSVPKGTLHAHKHVGEGVGRMLLTQTPGGLYERFFEEVGIPVDGEAGRLTFEDHADVGRVAEIGARYGIEIPPPSGRSRSQRW